MSSQIIITRTTQIAYAPDCSARTDEFIGFPVRSLPNIANCIYLRPEWHAYKMPTGEIAIIVEKVASRVVHILADYASFIAYKNAPMPDPETGRYPRDFVVGLGVGFGYGSYAIHTNPSPTIEQLKTRRAECVRMALVTYRLSVTRHPKDTKSAEYWRGQCRYWTDQAYHAHGELMAQLERPEFPVYYDAQGREHAEF